MVLSRFAETRELIGHDSKTYSFSRFHRIDSVTVKRIDSPSSQGNSSKKYQCQHQITLVEECFTILDSFWRINSTTSKDWRRFLIESWCRLVYAPRLQQRQRSSYPRERKLPPHPQTLGQARGHAQISVSKEWIRVQEWTTKTLHWRLQTATHTDSE